MSAEHTTLAKADRFLADLEEETAELTCPDHGGLWTARGSHVPFLGFVAEEDVECPWCGEDGVLR